MLQLRIHLNTETESKLREEALANGMDVATFVTQAVQEKLAATTEYAPTASSVSPDDWLRQFSAWADDHPQVPHLDTSRSDDHGSGAQAVGPQILVPNPA